jgi:hypothetical protein
VELDGERAATIRAIWDLVLVATEQRRQALKELLTLGDPFPGSPQGTGHTAKDRFYALVFLGAYSDFEFAIGNLALLVEHATIRSLEDLELHLVRESSNGVPGIQDARRVLLAVGLWPLDREDFRRALQDFRAYRDALMHSQGSITPRIASRCQLPDERIGQGVVFNREVLMDTIKDLVGVTLVLKSALTSGGAHR